MADSNFVLSDILRNNIRNITPYSTARDEFQGVALVNLDANENSFGSVGNGNYNRYPDPYQHELKEVVSKIKGMPIDQIFLGGSGSDEGIGLLYTAFCEPGVDNAIVCPPTYGMYKIPILSASGIHSLIKSICASTGLASLEPVIYPPGAAFEVTSPAVTASVTAVKIIGLVDKTEVYRNGVFYTYGLTAL